jgi:hypothetical protein
MPTREVVTQWLQDNVQVFPEPETVTLSEFSVDWEDFSGDFSVSFDSVKLAKKLSFGLEASGKTVFYMPMFHSPLGVPVSYPAIEITDRTKDAILRGLRDTFPRLKGAGLDKETGMEITWHTPPALRIAASALRKAIIKVTEDYSITIKVNNKCFD